MGCMCAQTRPGLTLSSKRVFVEWSQNPCYLQGKKSLLQEKSPLRGIVPMTLHQAGELAHHTTSELFWPPTGGGNVLIKNNQGETSERRCRECSVISRCCLAGGDW